MRSVPALFVLALLAYLGSLSVAAAQSCAERPYCTQMRSCAEADFYLRQCGHAERDGDQDGIPCEALCGDTMELYLARRSLGFPLLDAPAETSFSCGKRRCGEMVSCAEARFHLTQCGVGSLDRDGDGVPCESLCRQ